MTPSPDLLYPQRRSYDGPAVGLPDLPAQSPTVLYPEAHPQTPEGRCWHLWTVSLRCDLCGQQHHFTFDKSYVINTPGEYKRFIQFCESQSIERLEPRSDT